MLTVGTDSVLLLPIDEIYKTIILPMTSIAMIPVLLVQPADSQTKREQYAIQDSKDIMEFMEKKFPYPSSPLIPATPRKRFISMLLELLADEWLLVQAMYWRWSPESLEKQKTFLEYEFGRSAGGSRASYAEKMEIG